MPGSVGDLRRMDRDLSRAADRLRDARTVRVVTHIDADGISAGAIADSTLERIGKDYTVGFEKKITDEVVESINSSPEDLVWVCDLGSGYLSEFDRDGLIITDHHVPDPRWNSKQTVLENYGIDHLNPHSYGIDGSYEVCGAGMTYLLSKEVDPDNIDLAHLAVVGAVGDFQDSTHGRLVGLNRTILDDAVINGDVIVEEDLRYFGRDTRPINQYLQYSSEPSIPGVSDSPKGCFDLLDSLGIPAKVGNRWRVWSSLNQDEHDRAVDRICELLGPEASERAVGEMYRVTRYDRSTGLGDAKEFATVLNSCGRYDDAPTGLRVCRGDVEALKVAENNRAEHRKHISAAMSYIRDNHLIRERRFIQWFDAGSDIRETVVGIVAGMILSSPESRRNLPIIAFADSDDGVKVSARANRDLVDRGLDLSMVMKTASGLVGGFGGGHTVAAGATIPPDRKEEFLDIVEEIISSQIV